MGVSKEHPAIQEYFIIRSNQEMKRHRYTVLVFDAPDLHNAPSI